MKYKYMTLDDIKPFEGLMRRLGVSKVSRGVTPKQGFLQTYKEERRRATKDLEKHNPNQYEKQLVIEMLTIELLDIRCVKGTGETWHEKRNKFLARHLGAVKKNNEVLFVDGMPTRRTLSFYAWAYDPSPKDTKKYMKKKQE